MPDESRKWNMAERLRGAGPEEPEPKREPDRAEKKYDERKTRIEDLNEEQLQEFVEQLNESIRGIEAQIRAAVRRDQSGERKIDSDWRERANQARNSKTRLRDKCIHRQQGHAPVSDSPRRKSFERVFFEAAQKILTTAQFEEIRAQANLLLETPKKNTENPYTSGLDVPK